MNSYSQKVQLPTTLDEIRTELSARCLSDYTGQAWHIVEPTTDYVSGWHIDAISEHLEAVLNGQIRNLLINLPPRHMKSLLVSVFWPTWAWIKKPSLRWLFSSYAESLSVRDSLKCRRIITSNWYQQRWGDRYKLTGDQNQKTRFENDKTGYRIATSVEGSATGEGGDIIAVDDPHNVKDARSDTKREAVLVWWDEVMSSRLNDPKTGAKVIVMQRVHEGDLSGHVLEQGGYEHLMLPAEYEPKRKCVTSIGWEDPRAEEGELLWPDRFGSNEIEDAKVRLGTYGYAGQMQQSPTPAGGGMFQREWFEIVREAPAGIKKLRYWDKAATEAKPGKDPDYTSGGLVGEKNGIYYIVDIQRMRGRPKAVEDRISQTAELDGKHTPIWMEQEPGSSGVDTIDHYMREVLKGYNFRGDKKTSSKIQRAELWSAKAEAGNVKLVKGSWNKAFLDEVEMFPNGNHDDQVDCVGGAIQKLNATTELLIGRA